MKLRAFVAMPFGKKSGVDGKLINFDQIYSDYISPALNSAGMNVFRADDEWQAGDIRTDMFFELLTADLVLVDITIPNPNVWYELGVRHALRARGVVIVAGGSMPTVFDVHAERKVRYGLMNGALDPDTLAEDIKTLSQTVKATMESWHGHIISPVYKQLPNLSEPDWKLHLEGQISEIWEVYDDWKKHVELARKAGNTGDMLVLADETPVTSFRAEAWLTAGSELMRVKQYQFALEQLERSLQVEPTNLAAQQKKGICLQRLALQVVGDYSLDRARQHYRDILEHHPIDAETWALLGRTDKDAWVASWINSGTSEAMKNEACYEDALLQCAIESYTKAFSCNPVHYYSGINALTLMYLYEHLLATPCRDANIDAMAGAVKFSAECEADVEKIFWALATLGDLEVLVGTPDKVKAAYKKAIAKSNKDWFELDSSLSQLLMLQKLGFKPDNVAAGIETFDRALQKLHKPEDSWQPRQVFLFSGHRVDQESRADERFPPRKEPQVAARIAELLDKYQAGPDDLALTQGANGGDIIFSEACVQRGVNLRWLQPFKEPYFVEKSVADGGPGWVDRYYACKEKLACSIRSAPTSLGQPPAGSDPYYPYERANLWLLFTALSFGIERVRFICLWDGGGGDGPGGTAHMYNKVKQRTGVAEWIDIRTL